MAHHVYANGHEIASRSSDGQSNAMGDVCFSPPTPAKVGVPVPYPNTVFGKDIRNGSRTVFIAGKEVALSDKSHFHTSIGDEGATKLYKKGAISNNVGGRAFFTTWSPNVKVEGEGVPRDMDTVTHNHSNPSNTALFPFLSRGMFGHACEDEEKKIKKACDKPPDDDKNSNAMPRRRRSRSLFGKKDEASDKKGDEHWSKDHCGGLLNVSNNSGSATDALEVVGQELDDLKDYLTQLDTFKEVIIAEVEQWAIEKGIKLAAKAGAKQAIGSFVPLAGNIIMGLTSVYDGYMFTSEFSDRKAAIATLIDEVKSVDKGVEELTNIGDRVNAIKDGNPMTIDGEKDTPAKIMGDTQSALAMTSACLRARKCSLVPYQNKKHAKGKDVEPSNNGGCCKGQTGHHLIPGSLISTKDKAGKPRADGLGCDSYEHGSAPTVCVESATKASGSHKRIHDKFDSLLSIQVEKSENAPPAGFFTKGPAIENGEMGMDTAIETAAESHKKAFPLSGCSKKCIENQLKDYYNKHCRKSKLRVKNQHGNDFNTDHQID